MKDYWTIADMLKCAGCSHATIYRTIASGKLPATRMGNTYCVPADAAAQFIAKHPRTVVSTSAE